MGGFAEMVSQLRPVSLGIVIRDKLETSDDILCFPSEHLPFTEGKIDNRPDTAITATWIPFGSSNRATSPDVYAGETVQLYRFADTAEYFWTSVFREPLLRRLERVIYSWSNVRAKKELQSTANSYFVEVSTRDKRIHLHTSKNDGEKCGYDILIDTGKGKFTIMDTFGNIVNLDSEPGNVNVKLNGSLFGAITKDISLTCTNAILNASGNISATAGADISVKAGGAMNLNSGGPMSLVAPVVNVTNLSATGGASVSGPLTGDGTANFNGVVTASGFNPPRG